MLNENNLPSEDMVIHTEEENQSEQKKNTAGKLNRTKKIRLFAMIALAFVLIASGIFAMTYHVSAAAYYTVDINPSICIDVDKDNLVIDVSYQNEDGKLLLENLDLKGLPIKDAIAQIISAAENAGYVTEGKYVLVGRFSDEENTALTDLQAQLENDFGNMINLLVISGTVEDKKSADEQNVSAGLWKLSKTVEGIELSTEDKVEDVIAKVTVNPSTNTQASGETGSASVTGSVSGEAVKISWTKATASNFSGYKVVASTTNPNPKYPNDGYIKYITDINTTSISLYEGTGGLVGDTYYYFSITYLYSDGSTIAGNAVKLKVPKKTSASTDSYASTNISGSISGENVSLNWNQITSASLDGYKVMYSFSDSTPVYGESGCDYKYWITDASTTSCTIDVTTLNGYSPGAVCYFSITALYDSHNVKKPGNTISFTMPSTPVAPYVSSTISGSISGNIVSLSWDKVTHTQFDGYKVMYSFSDSSPVYGESGCYYEYWITDASTTSCTIDVTPPTPPATHTLTGYTPGATCYFSITVLYNGRAVKEAGNVISFTMP